MSLKMQYINGNLKFYDGMYQDGHPDDNHFLFYANRSLAKPIEEFSTVFPNFFNLYNRTLINLPHTNNNGMVRVEYDCPVEEYLLRISEYYLGLIDEVSNE